MEISKILTQAYDILLVAGQSNAEGHGLGEIAQPYQEDERVHILKSPFNYGYKHTPYGTVYVDIEPTKNANIEVAKERIDGKDNLAMASFYLWFAKEYADKCLKDGRKVLIVETSIGGTGFKGGHWNEGDMIYKRMVEMADLSLSINPENKIVGVLWHQGEHDAYENRELTVQETGDYYQGKLERYIELVRGRYGKDLPFICAGFTHTFVDEYPEHCKVVMERLQVVCDKIVNARYIDTSDLQSNLDIGIKDSAHFCRSALKILGNRYFDAYQDIINK